MKIDTAEYINSYLDITDVDLPRLPQIAFIGRSNVGKSSLINHLVNRKKLVKTSSTPGKTQMINYFLINNSVHFVDLPGYGFAKAPERVRQQWLNMITSFLLQSKDLRLVILIVDSRHAPSKDDQAFFQLLRDHDVPTQVIANKIDKLKKNQLQKSKRQITSTLGLDKQPISHSALKKVGRSEIWAKLNQILVD